MIKDSLKQFVTYGFGGVAQGALQFILLPLYLRFFDPAGYGVISLLLVIISLLTLFANVGMVSALLRLYFEAEPSERKKLIGNTWLWYLFGATIGGIVLFLNAPFFSQMLFHTINYSYPFKLVGAFFFFSLLLDIPFTILQLEKRAGSYISFSLFKFSSDFVLKFYFIGILGRGIGGYFESGIIANIIILCSILPFTFKYVDFSLNVSYLKQLLRLGFPFVFSTIAIWTLGMSDRLILNYFCGEAAVGVYSLAYTFVNVFNIVLFNPSALFWQPFFFSCAAERSTEDTKRLLSRSLTYFFLAGSILYLAISLGTGDVLRLFTSLFASKQGYWQAAKLVPLLAIGPFLYLLSRQGSSALLLVKKPKFIAIAASCAAVASLGLNFLLIPRFGAFGAGLSTAIAYALYSATVYGWAQRLFPIKYDIIQIAKGALFLAFGFMIGWQIRIMQPLVSLFVRPITGVAIFALSIWFISNILTKAERRSLIAFLKDGRRRLTGGLPLRS